MVSLTRTITAQVGKANNIRILSLVKEYRQISRTDLAKLTELSIAAVSRIVQQLIENGHVVETCFGDSAGGRRPVYIEPNPESGYIIGVDFERAKARAAVFDFCGEIQFFYKAVIVNQDYFAGLFEALDACMDFLKTRGIQSFLLGIGIGVRGFLDLEKGVILSSNSFSWSNIPLRQILKDRYCTPVFMDLNARLAALGEWSLIYRRSVPDLTYVTASWGICAGVITGGRLLYGSNGSAGEIGLSMLQDSKEGAVALEQLCGGQMLLKTIRDNWDDPCTDAVRSICGNKLENLTLEAIIEATVKGDPWCGKLAGKAGATLGVALVNLTAFFNPRVLVLGGQLAALEQYTLSATKTLRRYLNPEVSRQVKLEISILRDKASMHGASLLVFQNLFPDIYGPGLPGKSVQEVQKYVYKETTPNITEAVS
jgi:predicted NBD/HSP70 family sugar kinase